MPCSDKLLFSLPFPQLPLHCWLPVLLRMPEYLLLLVLQVYYQPVRYLHPHSYKFRHNLHKRLYTACPLSYKSWRWHHNQSVHLPVLLESDSNPVVLLILLLFPADFLLFLPLELSVLPESLYFLMVSFHFVRPHQTADSCFVLQMWNLLSRLPLPSKPLVWRNLHSSVHPQWPLLPVQK